jgi:hypothetical protein
VSTGDAVLPASIAKSYHFWPSCQGQAPETPSLKVRAYEKEKYLINFRLTEDEVSALTKRAKECGYSREAYIRSVLIGRVPRPMPPPDYHAMMRELHAIGNNLNQISRKAHVVGVMDIERYDAAMRLFAETVKKIEEAVILPAKTN